MQKYFNNLIDSRGNVIQGVSVRVYIAGSNTLASLYSDDGVTPTTNPQVTDDLGYFSFYVITGSYDLKISGAHVSTYWIRDVLISDEVADYASSAGSSLIGHGAGTVKSRLDDIEASGGSALVGYGAATVKSQLDAVTLGKVIAAGSVNIGRAQAEDFGARFKDFGAQPSKPCVINRLSTTKMRVLRPLGGPFWQDIRLDTTGILNGPYSWNETAIREIFKFTTAAAPSFTYTGAWSIAGSANPVAYVGGVGKQFTNPTGAEKVDIAFTLSASADIYVIYTGRTTGGYLKAELNGDTNAAALLPSNGTYRYIDTYTPVDLQYRRSVMVASGVPAGSHTLRLTATTDKNAAVTGTRQVVVEALAVSGPDDGVPGDAGTDSPLWLATTAYAQYAQIRTSAGRYYSCSVAGTTGSTEPSHTSGTATDGTVTWTFMASSSYLGKSHTLQAAGSQLEYAYEIKPTGAPALEDVGGVVHGSEELLEMHLALDGLRVTDIGVNQFAKGRSIQVVQTIKATHSFTGSTAVNTTTLTHNVDPRGVRVTHEHTWGVAATLGFFYSAMWPLLHWGALEYRYGVAKLWTPQAGEIDLTTYYGQANPIVGRSPDFIMAAKGQALMPAGAAGVASSIAGDYTALCWLRLDPQSVDSYSRAGSLYAGMAANISGATAPGFSSVVAKMYFEKTSTGNAVTVAVGEKWTCSSFYGLQLIPNASAEPWK